MRAVKLWTWAVAAMALLPQMALSASLWTHIDAPNPPSARFNHTMTLDPAGQKLVVFGGRTGSGTLGDTWVYDLGGRAWHEVKGTTSPPGRFGHAAAYDPQLRRVLIFGGQAGAFFNDVWSFDPQGELWQKLETKGKPPSKRYGTSAVLDTKRNQLIVSHGFTDAGRFDDTLGLDLKTNTWSKLQPVGGPPLKRCLHASAYDAKSDRMLLFGGCSSGFGPCPQGDFWSLDVARPQWQDLLPGGEKPSARLNPTLISDEAGRVLLFGGSGDEGNSAEVWRFSITDGVWTRLATTGGPAPRESHSADWDAAGGRMLIFGGSGDNGSLNDLWSFTP